eukprot:gnl/Chilomastix_cuspidata/5437.p1 GENE.gnl/Chilomastix_cuspidata/5437~~gnl/Chilomastix_cuspidata/5437.p1  ORF type:complete len:321 (+),score=87.27 gnl/Chilomastix_cuspidata/5437:423-1385(+)
MEELFREFPQLNSDILEFFFNESGKRVDLARQMILENTTELSHTSPSTSVHVSPQQSDSRFGTKEWAQGEAILRRASVKIPKHEQASLCAWIVDFIQSGLSEEEILRILAPAAPDRGRAASKAARARPTATWALELTQPGGDSPSADWTAIKRLEVARMQALLIHLATEMEARAAKWRQRGDAPAAKEFLLEASQYRARAREQLEKAPSVRPFRHTSVPARPMKNMRCIDLHGLTVRETRALLQREVKTEVGKLRGKESRCLLTCVTGRGLHSVGGMPKLLPEVERFAKRNGIEMRLDTASFGGAVVLTLRPQTRVHDKK